MQLLAVISGQSYAETLKQQNARLRAENKRLSEDLAKYSNDHRKRRFPWRTIATMLLLGLSVAVAIAGNVLFWAGNTIVKTDRYIATVSPLPKDPAIHQAVATYANDQFYKNVDINQLTAEVLPPRADFLAEPIATQLKNSTQKTLQTIVASPRFSEFWDQANTKSHERLIAAASKYEGNGTINLNEAYQYLGQRLKETKLSFLADKQLPANVGSITVVEANWLPAFHNLVTNIDTWRILAIILLVATAAGGIWLSKHRRKTVITLGWLYVAAMFLTLVAIRIGREAVSDHVASTYSQAAKNAYQIVGRGLVVQTRTLLVVGLLIVIIAWLSGPSKSARGLKIRINQLLSGNLHRAIFGPREPAFSIWIGKHKAALLWTSVGIISLAALFVQLTPKMLLVLVLLMILAAIIIETLASPSTTKPSNRSP